MVRETNESSIKDRSTLPQAMMTLHIFIESAIDHYFETFVVNLRAVGERSTLMRRDIVALDANMEYLNVHWPFIWHDTMKTRCHNTRATASHNSQIERMLTPSCCNNPESCPLITFIGRIILPPPTFSKSFQWSTHWLPSSDISKRKEGNPRVRKGYLELNQTPMTKLKTFYTVLKQRGFAKRMIGKKEK